VVARSRAPLATPPPPKVWKVRRFAGGTEHGLRAEVVLVSTTKEAKPWVRPPISMSFQVRGQGPGVGDLGRGGRERGGAF
jgi:hypothetical protein